MNITGAAALVVGAAGVSGADGLDVVATAGAWRV